MYRLIHIPLLTAAIALLSGASLLAQKPSAEPDSDPSRNVVIGVKGGVAISSPRSVFPSLRMGESVLAAGEVSSKMFGESGMGNRVGIEIFFPFNGTLGLVLDAGMTTSVVKFTGDSARLPIRFDIQKFGVGFGLEGNIYTSSAAFAGTGLRAVYVGGLLDIDVVTLANRLESSVYPDTTGVPVRGVGSFENNDPFRSVVSFRPQVGLRFGVSRNTELGAEAGYNFALNPLFSGSVVAGNDFTIDNWLLQVGVGYRF